MLNSGVIKLIPRFINYITFLQKRKIWKN